MGNIDKDVILYVNGFLSRRGQLCNVAILANIMRNSRKADGQRIKYMMPLATGANVHAFNTHGNFRSRTGCIYSPKYFVSQFKKYCES